MPSDPNDLVKEAHVDVFDPRSNELIHKIESNEVLGKGKRHEIIYEEVANMPPKKKRIYKILNVIHIVLILSLFFGMSEYLRANN